MRTRRGVCRGSGAVTLLRRWSLVHGLACALIGCTLDISPVQPSGGARKNRGNAQTKPGRTFVPPQIDVGAARGATSDADAGPSGPVQDAQPAHTPAGDDAGPALDASTVNPRVDAGMPTQPSVPTDPPATTAPVMSAAPCDRELLRRKADAYMAALTTGEAQSLNLHPRVRYTENGRDAMLGSGIWTRHATVDFARHAVDEVRCTTVTQAVLSARTVRSVFGVRLHYQDGQLLEAEAQVVPDNLTTLIDIETLIPDGNDPWAEVVPPAMRSSRAELLALAERYFDAAAGGIDVPPSAAGCTRHQNGAPLGDGKCNVPPGKMRFEQRRLPAVDETYGIVTAIVLYDDYIGQYMIRVIDGVTQSVEITGGASSATTGW